MNSEDLKQRTKSFAKRVLKVVDGANELVAIMTASRKTACRSTTRGG